MSTLSINVSARSVAKSKTSRRPGDSLCPPRPCAPQNRQHRPQDLAVGRAGDLSEAAFVNRERRDAQRDAVDVDPERRRFGFGCWPAAARGSSGFNPFGQGSNGGRPPAWSAIRYGRAAARKAELELDTVVDRVERAHRKKVQVACPRGSNAGL